MDNDVAVEAALAAGEDGWVEQRMASKPKESPDYIAKLVMLPEHMRGGMRRYIERGIPPGQFMQRLLENDFMGAIGRADDENVRALKAYSVYLYNYCPSGCYGSPERVDAWIGGGGMNGREQG